MEKVIITKKQTFEQGLFGALATLEPSGFVEVCGSTKAYTRDLISKWNRSHDSPQYKLKVVAALEAARIEEKVIVVRTK